MHIIDLNLIQHLGYLFTFLALTIKDVLWLRIILAIAQILLGIYQLQVNRIDIVVWNGIFTAVNIYHIINIIRSRKPLYIPKEIEDIYNNIFNHFTDREFMNFWSLGKNKKSSNSLLIKEGEKQKKLYLILSGTVNVKRNNKILNTLKRGNFIAEMSLITNEPASADIYSNKDIQYIMWEQAELRHFEKTNKDLWIKLHNILSKDLIEKIKTTN